MHHIRRIGSPSGQPVGGDRRGQGSNARVIPSVGMDDVASNVATGLLKGLKGLFDGV